MSGAVPEGHSARKRKINRLFMQYLAPASVHQRPDFSIKPYEDGAIPLLLCCFYTKTPPLCPERWCLNADNNVISVC